LYQMRVEEKLQVGSDGYFLLLFVDYICFILSITTKSS
jgi:hypothetical protein